MPLFRTPLAKQAPISILPLGAHGGAKATSAKFEKGRCTEARPLPPSHTSEVLVWAGDTDQPCAHPEAWRFSAQEPPPNRCVAQTLGRAKSPAQRNALPVGHVHAELLHQSSRQGPGRRSKANSGARQERAARSFSSPAKIVGRRSVKAGPIGAPRRRSSPGMTLVDSMITSRRRWSTTSGSARGFLC